MITLCLTQIAGYKMGRKETESCKKSNGQVFLDSLTSSKGGPASWKGRGERELMTNSHPAKDGVQGALFRKERNTPTHPDGSCPDPGGHPHGQFCASRGWWQDPRAARRKKNREGSPRPSHPQAGETLLHPKREGSRPRHPPFPPARLLAPRSHAVPRLPRAPCQHSRDRTAVPSPGRREQGHTGLHSPAAWKRKGLGASGSTNPSASGRGTRGRLAASASWSCSQIGSVLPSDSAAAARVLRPRPPGKTRPAHLGSGHHREGKLTQTPKQGSSGRGPANRDRKGRTGNASARPRGRANYNSQQPLQEVPRRGEGSARGPPDGGAAAEKLGFSGGESGRAGIPKYPPRFTVTHGTSTEAGVA